jgi:hypothetical protein
LPDENILVQVKATVVHLAALSWTMMPLCEKEDMHFIFSQLCDTSTCAGRKEEEEESPLSHATPKEIKLLMCQTGAAM